MALLLQEQGKEVDLEEQVAKLVQEFCRLVRLRRLGDLVGLLDRVRDDRQRCLLAIPGTIAPEPTRQLLERDERVAEGSGVIRLRQWMWRSCRWRRGAG